MPTALRPPIASSEEIHFVGEQLLVIDSPAEMRQVVEAGPGTGKTAVACARIVKLLRDGLNPSSILMISFTRAAVREMRDRIRGWPNVESAGGLKITTIDQTAFRFAKGGGADAGNLLKGFDVTMAAAVDQLRTKQGDIVNYIRTLKHVLIDEAQDITDIRSEFVEALIEELPKDCGVTVLADSCQAIYGFTHDQCTIGGREPRQFLATCRLDKYGFAHRSLDQLHRTQDAKLVTFFSATRKALLAAKDREDIGAVIRQIHAGGNSLGEHPETFGLKHGDLVLFRKRAQALHAANFFHAPYRLRLPGYPPPIYPWVALCLSTFTGRTLTASQFSTNWSENVPGTLADGWTPDRAFQVLRTTTGSDQQVDMRKLRMLLAQPRPPIELCYPDYGAFGPVFSTIHASKGREADRVILMLPRDPDRALERMTGPLEAVLEEARVYYVGATRVRKQFAHGIAATLADSRKLRPDNDREVGVAFNSYKSSKFQFGRTGDIAEANLISRRADWCDDDTVAAKRQAALVQLWKNSVESGKETQVAGSRYGIRVGDAWHYCYKFSVGEQLVGYSGNQLVFDLLALAAAVRDRAGGTHKPPQIIPYLQFIGLRTVAIADDALAGELCEPYSESGLFLAPMITGFANVKTYSSK